jgi:trehalose synthase-fused probable maltokinase
MTAGAGGFLDAALRTQLEQGALVPFLMGQRWFGGKARQIASASFVEWAALENAPVPAWLTIVGLRYADGSSDRYHVPLVLLDREAADLRAVLARVSERDPRVLCDGIVDDRVCRAILRAILQGSDITGAHGIITGRPMTPRAGEVEHDSLSVVRLPAVHSNSALAIGGKFLLKIFRRVEAGLNPDVEIGQFLAQSGAPGHTPALIGTADHRDESGAVATIAMVQELVPARGNAWDLATAAAAAFLNAARRDAGAPDSARVRALPGNFLESAALIGRRTAELHAALGAATADPAFVAETSAASEIDTLVARISRQATETLDRLRERAQTLEPGAAAMARRLIDLRDRITARIESIGLRVHPFIKIRIHGDYHLGQLLRVDDDDFVIIDFEGEPSRPLSERRAKQSPLRDVAGMLRSLDYAAHAGLGVVAGDDAEAVSRLAGWSRAWETAARTSFLEEYTAAARRAALLPPHDSQLHAALALFVIEKAFYELNYEMNNRPAWISTPLAGILAILDGSDIG